jgi:hypothetical protein
MAMVDLLCEAREKAEIEKTAKPTLSVEIYTLATLTGHVIRAYGYVFLAALRSGRIRFF